MYTYIGLATGRFCGRAVAHSARSPDGTDERQMGRTAPNRKHAIWHTRRPQRRPVRIPTTVYISGTYPLHFQSQTLHKSEVVYLVKSRQFRCISVYLGRTSELAKKLRSRKKSESPEKKVTVAKKSESPEKNESPEKK